MDTDEQLPPPNLAARIAVWATKRGHGSTIGKPVIFLLLILCWFSLTSLGAWQASPEPDVGRRLADALYAPFTFLAPQDSYLNQTESALLTDPLLWFGRFFGAAIPVYAIVWAAIAWGRRRMAHALLPLARGHVILFSEPGEGDIILRLTLVNDISSPQYSLALTKEGNLDRLHHVHLGHVQGFLFEHFQDP